MRSRMGRSWTFPPWLPLADPAGPGCRAAKRVYSSAREVQRDLAAAVLVDVSLSTDSWVEDRRVLDIEKEALAGAGRWPRCLRRRERGIHLHLAAARAGLATHRQGVRRAAERHRHPPHSGIEARPLHPHGRRGAPRRAAPRGAAAEPPPVAAAHRWQAERCRPLRGALCRGGHPQGYPARRDAPGQRVFGITVDREARDYFPYIFGPGAYAIFPHIARLPAALPAIYRQLVTSGGPPHAPTDASSREGQNEPETDADPRHGPCRIRWRRAGCGASPGPDQAGPHAAPAAATGSGTGRRGCALAPARSAAERRAGRSRPYGSRKRQPMPRSGSLPQVSPRTIRTSGGPLANWPSSTGWSCRAGRPRALRTARSPRSGA